MATSFYRRKLLVIWLSWFPCFLVTGEENKHTLILWQLANFCQILRKAKVGWKKKRKFPLAALSSFIFYALFNHAVPQLLTERLRETNGSERNCNSVRELGWSRDGKRRQEQQCMWSYEEHLFKCMAGLQCHAIENKNHNHSMN